MIYHSKPNFFNHEKFTSNITILPVTKLHLSKNGLYIYINIVFHVTFFVTFV